MTPEQLERLSKPIVDLFTNIEQELLVNVANRLKHKKELLETDAEAWKLQQMEILGLLDEDNLKAIRDHLGVASEELNSLLVNAGLEGLQPSENEIKELIKRGAQLATVQPIMESPQILSILTAYERQAKNVLNLTNQTLLDQTRSKYADTLNKVSVEVGSGIIDGESAIRKTVREWSDDGIPALITRDGRKLGVEGYVRTVMRSTTNNMVNEMQDTRFNEYGIELIEVTSKAGARPKCAPYQGRIFSLKPNHPRYSYIGNTSMGQPDGLFGINCGHDKFPFVEGFSEQTYKPYPKEENDRIYKESQRQRAIERGIRKAKTRLRMMEEIGDKKGIEQAKKLIRNRQATMREFIKDTGRTRRYGREQIY